MSEAKKVLKLKRAEKVIQLRHLTRAMAWLRRSGPATYGNVWSACMSRKKALQHDLTRIRRALREK